MRIAKLPFWKSACATLIAAAVLIFTAVSASAQGVAVPPQVHAQTDKSYKLGAGDKLRVIVFGEDNLGGVYEVDGSGYVRLPLIAQVQASGLSVHQFEDEVRSKLADGYLLDPRVSVEVINYRPFYIIGEVNKPGEYPYVNGMSVLNAVALAGGYTYRANDSEVYIRRNESSKEQAAPADQTTKISPGDIIRVAERFF